MQLRGVANDTDLRFHPGLASGPVQNFVAKTTDARFPRAEFFGQVVIDDKAVTTEQRFALIESPSVMRIESISDGLEPRVCFAWNKATHDATLTPKVGLNSAEAEILYTRLFWQLIHSTSYTISALGVPVFPALEIAGDPGVAWKKVEYRAKLFRKLRFLEEFYNCRFPLPEHIPWREALAVEVVFRAIVEGEFNIPAGSDFLVPVNAIDTKRLTINRFGIGSITFTVHGQPLLGVSLPVGDYEVTIRHAALDPTELGALKTNNSSKIVKVRALDQQVICKFDHYLSKGRRVSNNARLKRFKKALSRWEPDDLVSLVDEPLASIRSDVATKIVQGLLQFHNFPDRFSTSEPVLIADWWHLQVGLFYKNREPVWLDEARIHHGTGETQFGLTLAELRSRGLRMAKELGA